MIFLHEICTLFYSLYYLYLIKIQPSHMFLSQAIDKLYVKCPVMFLSFRMSRYVKPWISQSFLGQLLTYNRPFDSSLVGRSNGIIFRIKFSCIIENQQKMFWFQNGYCFVNTWRFNLVSPFQRMRCLICSDWCTFHSILWQIIALFKKIPLKMIIWVFHNASTILFISKV